MEPSRLNWRKASYSGTNGGGCVEVAHCPRDTVAVRDSKDPHGPVIVISRGEWARFTARLRATA